MDINIALKELREAIDELQCLDLSDEESSASSIEAVLGQFHNFDQLLSSGSPLPDDWKNSKKKTAIIKSLVNSEGEERLLEEAEKAALQLLQEAQQAGALELEVITILLNPDFIQKLEELGATVILDPPSNFCSIKWRRPNK